MSEGEVIEEAPDADRTVDDLLAALAASKAEGSGDDFHASAPDWFGDRVFGGVVVAQGLDAVCRTIDDGPEVHSLHASFIGALRPGPVELHVDRLRDGRTFSTRHVVSRQNERNALWMTVSFHAPEDGDEYQSAPPDDVPPPESLPPSEYGPPPFDVREIGPSDAAPDGTYTATRRYWARTSTALPDDPRAHVVTAGFLSDMTGTSFRPLSLEQWGTHTDASIDHAVWFHRPFRCDDWLRAEFSALVNHGGRATVRGTFHDRDGHLCMSMAQELLIRPLDVPLDAPAIGL